MNPVKINDTTYELSLPPGDRVEIGDRDSADFKPCARLNRWGTECSLFLSIPTAEKILPTIQGERILWQGRDYGAEFLAATDGFKFNIILPRRPETNVFPLDFGSDNLNFYYQPPLTEEFQEGWSEEFKRDILVTGTQVTDLNGNVLVNRPENVVGSYAVYHATKDNMHPSQAEAEKYKTGKAFHWYRPLIYDSVGKTTWGILNVDPKAGIRTITIPQEFLDNAVYPVTIDDDFGYTDAGASSVGIGGGTARAHGDTYTGASGTGTSMSVYAAAWSGDHLDRNIQMALYDAVSPSNYIDDSGTASVTIDSATPQWWQANSSGPSLSAIQYYLAFVGDQLQYGPYAYYDSSGVNNYVYKTITFGSWPSTISWLAGASQRQYSIYCTYTPSGGGATEKTGSDSGTGTDAKESYPTATLAGSEDGGGADSLPARDITLPEIGSGVDAFVSLQTPAAKTSSDAGSGVEAVPVYSAVLTDVESGAAVEAFIARLLTAAEAGSGAEASEIGGGGLLKHLFTGELGEGDDGLTAKIEIPNKGGGMKLWT
jgi:hypothetical protein